MLCKAIAGLQSDSMWQSEDVRLHGHISTCDMNIIGVSLEFIMPPDVTLRKVFGMRVRGFGPGFGVVQTNFCEAEAIERKM